VVKEKSVAIGIKKQKMKLDKEYLDRLISEALKKKKEESKEATATGGFGYSAPAFSMWSNDDKAKSEYKRPKVIEVSEEEEYCDACDRVKSQCVCPKKVEATEMTTTASVGPYDANSFQDKNMRGNTTKGQGRSWKKAQIPGGQFVSVKKECKTFPYCNQGDIKALNITKKPKKNAMYEAIENVSKKTGLTTEEIKNILIQHLGSNL
jgi:hypothetical protein